MQGVPTTVSVSSAFLQKCMNDPEKAKYLEENLAAIPDCAKSAVNAITGKIKTPFVIDNEKCIKCGTCKDNCAFGAIYTE